MVLLAQRERERERERDVEEANKKFQIFLKCLIKFTAGERVKSVF